MHQSTTPSQTTWPRWASGQFLSLPIVQTLPPVTFAYSLSSVVLRQLRRWGLPEVVGTVQQVYCSRRILLRRGLEFHVCTVNKRAHRKKVWKLIYWSSYIYIYIYIYMSGIGLAVRVFANGPGDLGSIPVRVIPKTQKMVLDASLLNTQHYKVRIKGKVKQSREGVAPSPTPWCSSYRKGSLRVTLDYGRQLYLLIYIYEEHLKINHIFCNNICFSRPYIFWNVRFASSVKEITLSEDSNLTF